MNKEESWVMFAAHKSALIKLGIVAAVVVLGVVGTVIAFVAKDDKQSLDVDIGGGGTPNNATEGAAHKWGEAVEINGAKVSFTEPYGLPLTGKITIQGDPAALPPAQYVEPETGLVHDLATALWFAPPTGAGSATDYYQVAEPATRYGGTIQMLTEDDVHIWGD